MGEKKILVTGDLITDIDYRVCNVLPLPEDPESQCLLNPRQTAVHPGGAANAALNLCNMGYTTLLIGIASGQLIDTIQQHGINVICPNDERDNVWCEKHRYFYDVSFEERNRIMVRIDQDPGRKAYEVYTNDLCRELETYLSDIDTVLLSDYDKGTINERLVNTIAEAQPKLWVIDPKYTLFPCYASPNVVLKPNAREALYITGTNNIIDAVHTLHNHYGCRVVVTCGSDGIWYAEQGKINHKEVEKIEPMSVVGAGDAAAAVLTAALSMGFSLMEAVDMCVVCCTDVITKPGTAPLSVDLWQRLINDEVN
jgi:D-beta-D-heptose 7-phosphate kinase/D-beta-D-heptose 1-phosphate adenosyltransferase